MKTQMTAHYKSKSIATWLAFAGGSLGLHRIYLHGLSDKLAWLHPLPTLAGLYGVQRMDVLGQDDRLAWVLMPILGLMLSISMLTGIMYGLTPDEKWDAERNPGQASRATRWAPVLGAVACLLVGGACLMTTIAFSAQRYFESQVDAAQELSQ